MQLTPLGRLWIPVPGSCGPTGVTSSAGQNLPLAGLTINPALCGAPLPLHSRDGISNPAPLSCLIPFTSPLLSNQDAR